MKQKKILNKVAKILIILGYYILRNTIDTRGSHFKIIIKNQICSNLDHIKQFKENRFAVVRQLHYSKIQNNQLILVFL